MIYGGRKSKQKSLYPWICAKSGAEVVMSHARQLKHPFLRSSAVALTIFGIGALVIGADSLQAQAPGPGAESCGRAPAVAPTGRAAEPTFPPGEYPVKLPAVSMLGARNDLPNAYSAGVDWGQLPQGRVWASTASADTGPDGNIWIIDRCAPTRGNCSAENASVNPIFELDPSGKVLKNIGAGLFVGPHKMSVDKDGNLWVADYQANVVIKLDPNGKVLMTLGKKGVAGTGNDEFDAPDAVAIAPNGDIFVSDGHTGGGTATGNARIVKFDKDGKFLMTWGKKGMGPGEFDVPHDLAFDSKGRLFVADRQNDRIQIFDQNGKFIAQWTQFGRPSGIHIDKNDTIYVADSESLDGRTNLGRGGMAPTGYGYDLGAERGIRIGSAKDGKVRAFIPDTCSYPYGDATDLAEGVTTDAQGNVYGADSRGDVRKFTKQ
jgi:sugar lactone lactonase YvrE